MDESKLCWNYLGEQQHQRRRREKEYLDEEEEKEFYFECEKVLHCRQTLTGPDFDPLQPDCLVSELSEASVRLRCWQVEKIIASKQLRQK